jgi:hypothetical protein
MSKIQSCQNSRNFSMSVSFQILSKLMIHVLLLDTIWDALLNKSISFSLCTLQSNGSDVIRSETNFTSQKVYNNKINSSYPFILIPVCWFQSVYRHLASCHIEPIQNCFSLSYFFKLFLLTRRSQWPDSVSELSSPSKTLASWVRIPLQA